MLQKVANRFLPAMRLATPDTDPILDSLVCKRTVRQAYRLR